MMKILSFCMFTKWALQTVEESRNTDGYLLQTKIAGQGFNDDGEDEQVLICASC